MGYPISWWGVFLVFSCEYMQIQWDQLVIFRFSRSCGKRVFWSFGERSASIFRVTGPATRGWWSGWEKNKCFGYMGRSSCKYPRCWPLKGPFLKLTVTDTLLELPFSPFHHCLVRFAPNFPNNHTSLSTHEREPDCHHEKGGSTFLPNVRTYLPPGAN